MFCVVTWLQLAYMWFTSIRKAICCEDQVVHQSSDEAHVQNDL